MMRSKQIYKISLLAVIIFTCLAGKAGGAGNESPTINQLSEANRQTVRQQLLVKRIRVYQAEQIKIKLKTYIDAKLEQFHKQPVDRTPDLLIQDSFVKTEKLFNQVSLEGDTATAYDPVAFEKNIQQYLWLRGIGSWLMGIGPEHQVAISYFYLPGNERAKHELFRDVVRFAFPEVPDLPANRVWINEMTQVMERIGYKIFNVEKYGL